MTVDENVKKAMGRIDRYLAGWRICQTPWQIIRTRLIELEALLADYENANKHSADDCVAKDVEITRMQSRLAAANALYADALSKPADSGRAVTDEMCRQALRKLPLCAAGTPLDMMRAALEAALAAAPSTQSAKGE